MTDPAGPTTVVQAGRLLRQHPAGPPTAHHPRGV